MSWGGSQVLGASLVNQVVLGSQVVVTVGWPTKGCGSLMDSHRATGLQDKGFGIMVVLEEEPLADGSALGRVGREFGFCLGAAALAREVVELGKHWAFNLVKPNGATKQFQSLGKLLTLWCNQIAWQQIWPGGSGASHLSWQFYLF